MRHMNSTMIQLSVTQVFIPMPIKIGEIFSKSPRPIRWGGEGLGGGKGIAKYMM